MPRCKLCCGTRNVMSRRPHPKPHLSQLSLSSLQPSLLNQLSSLHLPNQSSLPRQRKQMMQKPRLLLLKSKLLPRLRLLLQRLPRQFLPQLLLLLLPLRQPLHLRLLPRKIVAALRSTKPKRLRPRKLFSIRRPLLQRSRLIRPKPHRPPKFRPKSSRQRQRLRHQKRNLRAKMPISRKRNSILNRRLAKSCRVQGSPTSTIC